MLKITWPAVNTTIQDGVAIVVQFEVDPATHDDAARVNLQVDTDETPNNGNEIVIATGLSLVPPVSKGSFAWNTTGYPAGNYRVRGTASDDFNVPSAASATGLVTILPRPGQPPGGGGGPPPPPPNAPPQLFITAPTLNLSVDIGATIGVAFTRVDVDSTTLVRFVADPDDIDGNGNELVIYQSQFLAGASSESFQWDTTGAAPGIYRIVGSIDDNVVTVPASRPVIAVANGTARLVPSGTGQPSQKPAVTVDAAIINGTVFPGSLIPPVIVPGQVIAFPISDRGVRDNDLVEVRMILRNAEPEETLGIRVFADLDRNPNNDDPDFPAGDSPDPARHQVLRLLGSFSIQGQSYPGGTQFEPFPSLDDFGLFFNPFRFRVDTTTLPARSERDADGRPLPYVLRVVVDDGHTDGTGRPDHRVSGYSSGGLYVQSFASAATDLRDLGYSVSGARFQGIADGDFLGSGFARTGDLFNFAGLTPADDFVIIARFGTPRSRRNVGAAYFVLGQPQNPAVNRLAGLINASSISGEVAGSIIAGNIPTFVSVVGSANSPPPTLADPAHPGVFWSGITSVSVIDDVTGDQVPDLVVGVPFISGLYDNYDDDPCDCNPGCLGPSYEDWVSTPGSPAFPQGRPASDGGPDNLGFANPNDPSIPIDQGYVFVISGASLAANAFNDLRWTGQRGAVIGPFAHDDENNPIGALTPVPVGMRFRGGNYAARGFTDTPLSSLSEFGRTVASTPNVTGQDGLADLLVSAPGARNGRGEIILFAGSDWLNNEGVEVGSMGNDFNHSFPNLISNICVCNNCDMALMPFSTRGIGDPGDFNVGPSLVRIIGAADGDRLGFASGAGDFDNDGANDVVCGAPGRGSGAGRVYVVNGSTAGLGPVDLGNPATPRLELIGIRAEDGDATNGDQGDHFGLVQGSAGDINGDAVPDVFFAAAAFDDNVTVPGSTSVDAGMVGVVFGDPPNFGQFSVLAVGSASLPGVKFFGASAGALAGASVAAAGDFNRDGFGDLVIAAPGQTFVVPTVTAGGTVNQTRKGAAYLVFGGPHLVNQTFSLSQVGSPELPGIVFYSPYEAGTADEAAIDSVAGLGDIDGDGFDDIGVGLPTADRVNPGTGQRLTNTGDACVIYGNNFGPNQLP
ncbi:MAG: FG-GAP repeat protein [Phycisphaerae bacterium]